MFYGTNEERIKHIESKIKDLRAIATIYPDVKAVINDFDGKVYNKRFIDALEIKLKDKAHVYAKKEASHIRIEARILDNIKYDFHTIINVLIEDLTDGKRINAAKFIEALTSRREKFLKEAADLESSLTTIDGLKNQLESLINTYRNIYDSIPYEIRDTWNLKHV